MNKILLCAICSVLLLACGRTEQSTPVTEAVQATSHPAAVNAPGAANNGKADSFKIREFYIGMDIQSVPIAMMSILAEQQLSDFGFTEVLRAGDGTQCVLMYTKSFFRAIDTRMQDRYGKARAAGKLDEELLTSCINSDGVMAVKSGPDNRVNKIEFNDIKDLFNANGTSPAEFVKRFSKEFHLPEMKSNQTETAWFYVSPGGTQVEVDAQDVLGIPMLRLFMSSATR